MIDGELSIEQAREKRLGYIPRVIELTTLKITFNNWCILKERAFYEVEKEISFKDYRLLKDNMKKAIKTYCVVEIKEENTELNDTIHLISVKRTEPSLSLRNYKEDNMLKVLMKYDFSHWYSENYSHQEAEHFIKLRIMLNKA